jgi:NADP-dependent 3-hydroxy acid dehydrogenase YdfG
MTSYRANNPAWENISYDRLNYNCSKAALKTLSMTLKYAKKKNVKITSLEPSWVNTNLSGSPVEVPEDEYRNQTWQRVPIKPQYIARTIRWILSQPQELYVSTLEIENFILVNDNSPVIQENIE